MRGRMKRTDLEITLKDMNGHAIARIYRNMTRGNKYTKMQQRKWFSNGLQKKMNSIKY